jgi:addiction module HigA family antidote
VYGIEKELKAMKSMRFYMNKNLIELSTPGDVLKEEFLDLMNITPYALSKAIFVDPPRIASILKGTRKITADTALRFSKFFGNSPEFWMNMQNRYDLEVVMEKKGKEINKITKFHIAS